MAGRYNYKNQFSVTLETNNPLNLVRCHICLMICTAHPKSKRMRLAGYVTRKADTGIWWENLRERDYLEDPGVNGNIILRWIFRKWVCGFGLDRGGSGCGQVVGTCECGNEPPGFIKCVVCLDYLRTGRVLKKDSAICSMEQ